MSVAEFPAKSLGNVTLAAMLASCHRRNGWWDLGKEEEKWRWRGHVDWLISSHPGQTSITLTV